MPKAHSGTETGGRALDNQKYGEQESSMVALTKTPLGRYSSTGPEYEPIHQTAEIKRGGNQPVNRGHRLLPESRLNLRPASYEIPISSSTQTLNINK